MREPKCIPCVKGIWEYRIPTIHGEVILLLPESWGDSGIDSWFLGEGCWTLTAIEREQRAKQAHEGGVR